MTTPTIDCRGMWKVFGVRPLQAMEAFRSGSLTRAEIQKRFGSVIGVADASFTVMPGEIFCIMGLSGSGKSTLVRQINGLVPATAGEMLIDGESLTRLPTARVRALRAKKVGMVFQGFGLLPHRNVRDNVALGLELRGLPRAERHDRAQQALEAMRLGDWADARIDQLSGGMQQRVGIARALAGDPGILLMDEPFSALDPLIRRELQDQFLELSRRLQKTVVFITHDLDEAMRLGSRIAIMAEGRIEQIGTPQDILLRPANAHVAAFVHGVSTRDTLRACDVMTPAPVNGSQPAPPGRVPEGMTLAAVARAAAEAGGDLAVTSHDGRVIGVARVADILRALAGDERSHDA
ncbi:MAG: hypothetical protein B7Z10_03400 [Rhodobacterales bacterium 32-66-7]|nr:MAG: hypothetical protein B7Z31_00355 [Rhodobacterales bacterium 12-65-15]OYX26408.1 MAG: hypothetical protein B7Z10_03400 [Rhodobacterales bacterium 32-66-7]